MVNTNKGGLKGERVRPQSIRPQIKFPRGISDQVISLTLADGCNGSVHLVRASSFKLNVTLRRLFSLSHELQASSGRPQAASIKPQASKPQASASSDKPQASSSLILDPRYMDIEEVLGVQGPRVFAKINVLCG